MKKKRTETESNKNSKGKKKQISKAKKKEDAKVNTYEEYRIDKIDLISQSSEEDIETKMKKLIELKKKGVNLDEYNKNEIDKIQFKRIPYFTQEESKNESKQQEEKKEKEDKLKKIKNGLNNLNNFSNLLKKRIKKSIIQKLKTISKQPKKPKQKQKKESINSNTNINTYKKPLIKKETNENSKNNIDNFPKNKITDPKKLENNIEQLIKTISNLFLKEKSILFHSIIRLKNKRKTVRMTTTASRRGYVEMKRRSTLRRNSLLPTNGLVTAQTVKEIEEEEDFSFDLDESENKDIFIRMDRIGDIEKGSVDKSQLIEYDAFYKEQYYKNEVFNYDVSDIKDKEVEEINHEMNKLEAHRKLLAKKKEKDAVEKKGLDTTQLEKEIKILEQEYIKAKTVEKPKLNLIMNNTEGLLYKGRLLGFYFNGIKKADFPNFSLESSKEMGAKEIIDFKVLRKEEQARRYFDYHCCLEQRQKIYKWLVYTRFWCRFFVNNWIFDNLSLLIIIINTVLILISDPTDPDNLGNLSDDYFLYFYTVEAVLKIITFTFISAEDAYLKDYWNILDFSVVLVGWISFIIERVMNGTKITGLAGLRAFRILRPLKTVKRFKGLKKLVTALLASISHLGETTIVLIFVFLIFAIGGRQMWMGNFYRRCMNVNYGYLYSTQSATMMCSFDTDCQELNSYGDTYVCAKGYRNPDSGAINFDDTIAGFVTIFVMVTLEGWTSVFTYVSKTFKDKIFINPIIIFFYFHAFVILGAFYLINLFLAVTNSEFEKIEADRKMLMEKKSFFKLIKETFDPKEKLKKEKKKKDKKKKEDNNMKSDQALIDLYYKVKDEAYQITKNKRDIPVLYSTVQDIYIMSNNNPEELYLEEKRIDEEETFLSKDIKRQQREIDNLIDAKRKEMKEMKENKNKEENLKKMNTLKKLKSIKSFKSSNSGKNSTYKNEFLKKNETNVDIIKNLINKINRDLIFESVE